MDLFQEFKIGFNTQKSINAFCYINNIKKKNYINGGFFNSFE